MLDILYHDLRTQVTGAAQCDAAEHPAESRSVAKGHGLYLIPAFCDDHECDELMAVAAEYAARGAPDNNQRDDDSHRTPPPGWRMGFDDQTPKQRLPVTKLTEAQGLCDTLVRRTIALVEAQLPALGVLLFGTHAVGLADLDIRFSLNEPAVNIYGANGGFDEHEDGHMLTMVRAASAIESSVPRPLHTLDDGKDPRTSISRLRSSCRCPSWMPSKAEAPRSGQRPRAPQPFRSRSTTALYTSCATPPPLGRSCAPLEARS